MRYSRRGQKEYSVLKEADERQSSGGFIPLVVDGAPEGVLGIRDIRVRFTNGMELSNNHSAQMMRRIKMNLKNACNIGSERSARHNAFMYSVIESCRMMKRNVEDYLKSLLQRLRTARDGDDLTCCLPCYLPA